MNLTGLLHMKSYELQKNILSTYFAADWHRRPLGWAPDDSVLRWPLVGPDRSPRALDQRVLR